MITNSSLIFVLIFLFNFFCIEYFIAILSNIFIDLVKHILDHLLSHNQSPQDSS